MSFTASLRRCAPSATRAAKQDASFNHGTASSSAQSASKLQKRQHTLSSSKLRALISLYHQSDTFVTQDNLLQRINDALLPSDMHRPSLPALMPNLNEYKLAVKARNLAPKIAQSGLKDNKKGNSTWSLERPIRERKVIEAMYGLDMSHPMHVRPGLEAVNGARVRLEREASEDAQVELEKRS